MSALAELSKDIESLVDRASPFVVRVDARRGRAGTGIVWDKELVLTANHVVEQEEEIQVVAGENSSKATLVGRDPATDLALLRVPGLSAPAAPRATSTGLTTLTCLIMTGAPAARYVMTSARCTPSR